MKKYLIILISLIVLLLGFFMWSFWPSNHHNNKTVIVSYENTQTRVVINVIKEKKLLEKYLPRGTIVKWVMIDNSADLRDALATDRVSLGSLDNIRTISAIENNYPITILANGLGVSRAVYTTNPNIIKPEDLADCKRIAVQGTAILSFQKELESEYGFTLRDDQLIEISESDMVNMLTQGQIDAGLLTSSYAARAKALDPELRVVLDITPEVIKLGLANWFVASTKFTEQNPELINPIMSAYREAVDYINNNPRETAELLAPIYQIDASQIEQDLKAFPPVMEIYGYDELANIMYEQGKLDKKPQPFNKLPNYETIPKR